MQPAGREPLTVAAHDYLITLFMFLIELLSENAGGEKGGGGRGSRCLKEFLIYGPARSIILE